jgi:hypothetical protein
MGDNCAVLDADTILFLAPEIDSEQLAAFFRRILAWLPRPADEEIPYPIEEKDLLFVGTSVTKKIFKTPEELLAALKQEADSRKADHGAFVVDAEELKKKSEEGK